MDEAQPRRGASSGATAPSTLDAASPAARVLRGLCLQQLAEAEAAAARMGQGRADPEALHDLRVALRRLRSQLRAYRSQLPRGASRKTRRALRELASATGTARDLEVQEAWLARLRGVLPAAHRRAVEVLRAQVLAEGARAARSVREEALAGLPALRRRLEMRLAEDEEALPPGSHPARRDAEADQPGAPLCAVAGEQLVAADAELRAAARLIRGAQAERQAHAARIAAKRLRYLAEPLREASVPEVAEDARALVKHLKALQDALGELHDTHQLGHLVERALAEAPSLRRGLRAVEAAVQEATDRHYQRFRALLRGGTLRAVQRDTRRLADRLAALVADPAGRA